MSKRSATTTKTKAWPCTAEDITAKREEGLSWRNVGVELGLGSPNNARKAYTDLTGRPHQEAPGCVKRAPKGTGKVAVAKAVAKVDRHPHWDVDTDQDDIINALNFSIVGEGKDAHETYHSILVRRSRITGAVLEEEMVVKRINRFEFNKDETMLAIQIIEALSGATRTVYVNDIVEVF